MKQFEPLNAVGGDRRARPSEAMISQVAARVATFVIVMIQCCASAQIQEAWVARYNPGVSNSTNQAVAIALDSAGNVIVAGSSRTNGNFDYVTIKYSSSGTQLWVARYSSASPSDDQVRAMAVDRQGNVYLTGTSVTAKYDANGMFQWTAPYAGRALALDTNGNAHVTGFSTNDFATVKLNPMGSNVWLRTYDKAGCGDVSHAISIDNGGNVYVAGVSQFICTEPANTYSRFTIAKYNASGVQLWVTNSPNTQYGPSRIEAVTTENVSGSVYITGNSFGDHQPYATSKYDQDCSPIWSYYWQGSLTYSYVENMASDNSGGVYLSGAVYALPVQPVRVFGTIKLNTLGEEVWVRRYGDPAAGNHVANAVKVDGDTNVYVTGNSSGSGSGNDFATIKYDTNGNEKWVKRHDGPAHGDDQATAIAVDTNSGAVYVTGFSQNTSGGYDLTTIKYAFLQNIQLLTNGHAFLQFFGTPGQSYRFQGSINLSNWVDVGSNVADTNGIYRFEDTNSPAYPHRFYRTVTP